MRATVIVGAVAVGTAMALFTPARSDDKAEEPVPLLEGFWETDLTAARARARKEGKPLLVVFR